MYAIRSYYALAKELGHTIVEPKPALVPIHIKEKWVKDLAGLSLKYVTITAYQNGKRIISKFGEALFTHEGMSGPIIIDMSRDVGDALEKGAVELSIDFKPAIEREELDKRLQTEFKELGNVITSYSIHYTKLYELLSGHRTSRDSSLFPV